MSFDLPVPVLLAIMRLNERGYEAYAVGGCVRDMLRGVTPNDYDICVSSTPRETHAAFAEERVINTGIQHGTVTVLLGGMALEITTFRADGEYLDGRHPASVRFTDRLTEDLKRRDFTVNAMAYHPITGLVDLFEGEKDLKKHIIRCVGDPEQRLTEDALRILRAVRFASQLNFDIEEPTAQAMHRLRDRLSILSACLSHIWTTTAASAYINVRDKERDEYIFLVKILIIKAAYRHEIFVEADKAL